MKYYEFKEATGIKAIGRLFPQTTPVYTCSVEDPNFIDNKIANFKKIESTVIVPHAVVKGKSVILTDLLSTAGGYGFMFRKLISDRLKLLLDKSKSLGFQFLETIVYDKDNNKHKYWLLNSYVFFPEYIDYTKSELYLSGSGGVKLNSVACDSFEDYESKIRLNAPVDIYFSGFSLDTTLIEYDFFALNNVSGGLTLIVSEKLKKEIEAAGCTGIDFVEIN